MRKLSIFEPEWDPFLEKGQELRYRKQWNLSQWQFFRSRQAFSLSEGDGGVPIDLHGAGISPLFFIALRVSVYPSPRLPWIISGAIHHINTIHHINPCSLACHQAPGSLTFGTAGLWGTLKVGRKPEQESRKVTPATEPQKPASVQATVTHLSFGLIKKWNRPQLHTSTDNKRCDPWENALLTFSYLVDLHTGKDEAPDNSCQVLWASDMKERYCGTQRSWEFLFCCSRVKLDYFKKIPNVIQ